MFSVDYVRQKGGRKIRILNLEPEAYDFGTSTIMVTIPFDRSGFGNVNATSNATVKLTEIEKTILGIIAADGSITVDAISKTTGKHRTTILRNLDKLKNKGLIERIGSDKTGHWEIKR